MKNEIKWAYQRLTRGWDDRWLYDGNDMFMDMMLEMIPQLLGDRMSEDLDYKNGTEKTTREIRQEFYEALLAYKRANDIAWPPREPYEVRKKVADEAYSEFMEKSKVFGEFLSRWWD
jgi:hypothetical protein